MPKTWFITGASSGLGLGDDATVARPGKHGRRRDPPRGGVGTDPAGFRRAPRYRSARFGRAGEYKRGRWRRIRASRPDRRDRQQCRLRPVRCGGRADERRDRPADRHQPYRIHPSDPCRTALFFGDQGGGRIVQVSSEGGQIAYPGFSSITPPSGVSKAFVESGSHRKWLPSASTSLSPSRDRPARISAPISSTPNRWMPTMESPCRRRSPCDQRRKLRDHGRCGAHRGCNDIETAESENGQVASTAGAGSAQALFLYLAKGAFRTPLQLPLRRSGSGEFRRPAGFVNRDSGLETQTS